MKNFLPRETGNIWFQIPLLIVLFSMIGCSQTDTPPADPMFDSIVRIADACMNTDVDSALTVTQSLMEYSAKSRNPVQAFKASHLRGKAYESAGKNDSALYFYYQMYRYAYSLSDTSRLEKSCNMIGSIFIESGSNDSVAYWFKKGKVLADIRGDTLYQAVFSSNMGLYFDQNNQPDSAMKCYTMAALSFAKLCDSASLAQAYRNIGNVLSGKFRYREATIFYYQSLQINQQTQNHIEEGLDYLNLAIAFKNLERDTAGLYFKKATDIFKANGNLAYLTRVKFNYGNFLKSIGRTDQAEQLYQEVLEISENNNILMGQIYSLNLLAKIATIKGNASLADAYFNRALQLSAKNNFTRDMLRLYREIFESKLQLNDANAALNYFKLWDKLNDSLQTSQQNEAITKYQVLYETQKKDMSIRLLEEENEQRRIRAQLSGIVFIAAILTFIILIYFARLHEKHARNKLFLAEEKQKVQQLELNNQELILKNAQQDSAVARQELQAQQRLLVSKMLILSHNNEFLANLLRNLQALNQKTDESASGKQLIDTLKLIKNEIQPGRWDEFEKLYHESHAGFYQKLNEHHPGLTPGEHRLCAMLRMDLSIKEISLLTLQSNRAVEMARHRLRTKLGIEREDNLTAYLSQF